MSNKINDGGPAFPVYDETEMYPVTTGMTLRDWFAGLAMMGICSNPDESAPTWPGSRHDVIATSAYSLADAMLNARNEGDQE